MEVVVVYSPTNHLGHPHDADHRADADVERAEWLAVQADREGHRHGQVLIRGLRMLVFWGGGLDANEHVEMVNTF